VKSIRSKVANVARFFRFVEKKRGQRRTGSNLVGSLGEAVFFGVLFLLGTFSLSALIVNYVLAPDPGSFAFGVGRWLLILVMGSLAITGGGGLIWTVLRVGTSAERRSAMASQANDIDLVNETVPRPRNYPTIPPYDGLTNSPGIELAFRLPPSRSPGWRLLASTIFVLLWNGVGCFLTVWAIGAHLAGNHEWFLTALLVPYWAVSAWSIRDLLTVFLLHTGMGMTTVEISDLPLLPGREYRVALSQHGHIAIKSIQLWLVCEEEATYTQGTDVRTEVREVYSERFYERGGFRIDPTGPFHDAASFTLRPDAMHSFTSQHHAIRWKLVVRGEAERWPQFERGFPLVVYPGEATMQVEVSSNVARAALRVLPTRPNIAEARA
jgi:hypothetical protein